MRNLTFNERLLITFKRKECGLTVSQLADQLHMSKSNLSRIENGKIMVSEENEKLLEERFSINFSLGEKYLTEYNVLADKIIKMLIFYKLFDEYSKDKLECTHNNVLRSVAYPYFMLIRLFVYSVKNIEQKFVKKYLDVFDKLIPYLDKKHSRLFYMSKVNFEYFNKNYEEAIVLCDFIESNYNHDELLDSYLYHIKAITYGCLGKKIMTLKTLDEAIFYSMKTNNIVRKIALNITKANYKRLRGEYKQALIRDRETIEYSEDHDVHIYDYILNRNIAWTYYLLEDYVSALEYYSIAETYDIDNDLCFMKALCSYRLGLRKQCEQYLLLGRRVKSSGVSFPYLLDWLELMLNKKYSKKAEQKLLYCLRKFKETMHVDSIKNIYILLIDHYSVHKEWNKVTIYKVRLNMLLSDD